MLEGGRGHLVEVVSLLIDNKCFVTLTSGRSIECGRLMEGRLIKVLYLELTPKGYSEKT